jgi:predicted nucleotidyltransferase
MKPNLGAVLKRKLPALKRLFENAPRVLGVWPFGSQADGTATPYSDSDLE